MLSIDLTFVLVLVSFLGFMLAMKAVFFDPIQKVKEDRAQKLKTDRESAHNAAETHNKLNRDYEAQLREARKRAQQVIQEIRQEAKGKAGERVLQARENARQELEAKMEELARQREEVYEQLAPNRKALAHTIVEKVRAGSQTPVNI
jgi:F-type H+-transporting ATPase subunit b